MNIPYDRNALLAALDLVVPYVRLYRDRTFVVKIGGSASADRAALTRAVKQADVLSRLGMRVVLVHGGGPQATRLAERLGVAATFVDGRRVTPPAMLEAVVMALNGEVNTAVLAACRAIGMSAVGVSGVDGALIRAQRRPVASADFGEVGDILSVDATVLERLSGAGFVPVVSPLAADDTGRVLNVNADTAAARIAASLGAEKLIFLTDTRGILESATDPSSLISYVDLAGLDALEARGVLAGGMLPKVAAARAALAGGVKRVHIVGNEPAGSLLAEIFTNEGAGTLIVRDRAELQPAELSGLAPVGSA